MGTKSVTKCTGCGAKKYVNAEGLCKKCRNVLKVSNTKINLAPLKKILSHKSGGENGDKSKEVV